MGKQLRPEHIGFFTDRMDEHSRVLNWVPIEHQHECLFRIRRSISRSQQDVVVHLTDAYLYGLAEFYARPSELKSGSFVVIGMPHADTSSEVIEEAKKYGIGIGHIGKFMGALNVQNVWEYLPPEERRREEGKSFRRRRT